jgi:hypothetical protein
MYTEGVPYIARMCIMMRMMKRTMIHHHHSESDDPGGGEGDGETQLLTWTYSRIGDQPAES